MVSARMKPFSKSVWMTPAACGALVPLVDRPGARLLGPDGEIGDEAEKLVAGADDAVEAGLGEADRLEIVLLLVGGRTAISLSILAETTTALAPSCAARSHDLCRNRRCPCRPTASSTLQT